MEVGRFTSITAYTLSLRGAAQLLRDQSLLPNAKAIDVGISDFCSRQEYGRPCYGAYPMLFGRFRGIGPKSRDSDRRTSSNEAVKGSGGGQAKEDGLLPESEFTVFPVCLNLKKLMKGETVLPPNDQERDMLKSVDLESFVMPLDEEVLVKQVKQ